MLEEINTLPYPTDEEANTLRFEERFALRWMIQLRQEPLTYEAFLSSLFWNIF